MQHIQSRTYTHTMSTMRQRSPGINTARPPAFVSSSSFPLNLTRGNAICPGPGPVRADDLATVRTKGTREHWLRAIPSILPHVAFPSPHPSIPPPTRCNTLAGSCWLLFFSAFSLIYVSHIHTHRHRRRSQKGKLCQSSCAAMCAAFRATHPVAYCAY